MNVDRKTFYRLMNQISANMYLDRDILDRPVWIHVDEDGDEVGIMRSEAGKPTDYVICGWAESRFLDLDAAA